MSNRIHACLDGETPLDALTSDEQQQVAGLVTTIEAVATEVRGVRAPDLTARVMDAAPARTDAPARQAAFT